MPKPTSDVGDEGEEAGGTMEYVDINEDECEVSEGEEEVGDSDGGSTEAASTANTSQPGPSKKKAKVANETTGQCLMYERSAYHMYHQIQTQSPCLSFDIIPDLLGADRDKFPHTCYLAAGTQAAGTLNNRLMVMKIGNLHKMSQEDTDDEESGYEDEEEGRGGKKNREPDLKIALMTHKGCVNRIRVTKLHSVSLAASWSESGKVHVWDLTKPLHALDDAEYMKKYVQNKEAPNPTFTFPGHTVEGYAMDWSTTMAGRLVTGDCKGNIHMWSPQNDGSWTVDRRPYFGHTDSVEDIQWSPNEDNVFSTCSVDKSLRVWDTRAPPLKACMLTVTDAHDSDVNVISWNRHEPFIVSGGDDGLVKIWDLRQLTSCTPVAVFKYHGASITSVQWHPSDTTVFAAAGADDKLTQWDIAAERDDSGAPSQEIQDLPPQLLFVHQGQTDIKELHWHKQIPGVVVSTALSGFDLFRTISV